MQRLLRGADDAADSLNQLCERAIHMTIIKLANQPHLLLTGGRIQRAEHDTGAGHVSPAMALAQEFIGDRTAKTFIYHANVANGKPFFKVFDPVTRSWNTVPFHEPLAPSFVPVIATTGFGSTPFDRHSVFVPPELQSVLQTQGKKVVTVVPDVEQPIPDEGNKYLGRAAYQFMRALAHPIQTSRALYARYNVPTIRWGLGSDLHPNTAMALRYFPFMTNDALEAAREVIQNHNNAAFHEETWRLLEQHIKSHNPNEAKAFAGRRIKYCAKKPVFITGSSRGDYTYIRALALASQDPDRHIIVNAGEYGNLLEQHLGKLDALFPNVTVIRKPIPQKLYARLRGSPYLVVWGSTGASEVGESFALPGYHIVNKYPDAYKSVELEYLKSKGVPDDVRRRFEHVDLQTWNIGQIYQLEHDPKAGMHVASDLKDVARLLEQYDAVDPGSETHAATVRRAAEHYFGSVKARRAAASFLRGLASKTASPTNSDRNRFWATEFLKTGAFDATSVAKTTGIGAAMGSVLGGLSGYIASEADTKDPSSFDDVVRGVVLGSLIGGGLGAAAPILMPPPASFSSAGMTDSDFEKLERVIAPRRLATVSKDEYTKAKKSLYDALRMKKAALLDDPIPGVGDASMAQNVVLDLSNLRHHPWHLRNAYWIVPSTVFGTTGGILGGLTAAAVGRSRQKDNPNENVMRDALYGTALGAGFGLAAGAGIGRFAVRGLS